MTHNVTSLDCREIGAEQIEVIRPLWEKLNAYHVLLSPPFAARRSERTFDARRREFLAKAASGKLKVDATYADAQSAPVAYCVTSLSADGSGEIDSLFVEKDYRGNGIGTVLMRRALEWLDAHHAVSKTVTVAFGNDSAIEFYREFGFLADNVSLRQISDKDCQPDGAANGSQPIRSETNRTSSAAGSRR